MQSIWCSCSAADASSFPVPGQAEAGAIRRPGSIPPAGDAAGMAAAVASTAAAAAITKNALIHLLVAPQATLALALGYTWTLVRPRKLDPCRKSRRQSRNGVTS